MSVVPPARIVPRARVRISSASGGELDLRLRPADADDHPTVWALSQQFVPSGRLRPRALDFYSGGDTAFVVATHQSTVVGCCGIRTRPGATEILNVAVAASLHGRGVGTVLLRHVLASVHGPVHLVASGRFTWYRTLGFRTVTWDDIPGQAPEEVGPSSVPMLWDGVLPPVRVEFRRSGAATDGRPDETVLESGERLDLDVESMCRAGVCGTCRVELLAGAVFYDYPPVCAVSPGWVLACSALPLTAVAVDR